MAGVSKLGAALAVALAAAPITDGALRVEVDRLVVAVATARHFPAHPVPAALLTREAAARQAALALGASLGEPRTAAESAILRRLGLLPAGPAAEAAWATAPARAAARYDSTTGRLLVPNDVPLDAQRPVLAHEVAHALADQRFGLRRFLHGDLGGGRKLEGDGARARLALVEGDATLAGLEVLDPREGFLVPPELDAMVARLGDALTASEPTPWLGALQRFTHLGGFLFVARVRSRRPWSAVDALWSDPPASTEQILHPERYEACDAPIAVDAALLPTIAGLGRPPSSDVLGELVVRAWLGLALPPELAARGATGWGGDRAGLYASPGTTEAGPDAEAPLAWLTVWDDAGEADDFARAAAQALARSAEASVEPPPDGARASAEPPGGARAPAGRDVVPFDYDGRRATFHSAAGMFALGRADAAVAILLGAPEAALPALDQMLEGWRRQDAAIRRAARRPGRAAQPGCPRRDRAAGSP